MKINRLHAIIGFFLVVIPFTGFGHRFTYVFSVIAGGTILYFAMRSIHDEIMKKHHRHRRNDSFVENRPKDSSKNESKIEKPVSVVSSIKTEEVEVSSLKSTPESQ